MATRKRKTTTTAAATAAAAAVPLLLTSAQTAALLGDRSPETLKSWRRAGVGPRYIVGPSGRLLGYRPADVDEWLASQSVRGGGAR